MSWKLNVQLETNRTNYGLHENLDSLVQDCGSALWGDCDVCSVLGYIQVTMFEVTMLIKFTQKFDLLQCRGTTSTIIMHEI